MCKASQPYKVAFVVLDYDTPQIVSKYNNLVYFCLIDNQKTKQILMLKITSKLFRMLTSFFETGLESTILLTKNLRKSYEKTVVFAPLMQKINWLIH